MKPSILYAANAKAIQPNQLGSKSVQTKETSQKYSMPKVYHKVI